MSTCKDDFVQHLYRMVQQEIAQHSDMTYTTDAIQVVDARNLLFCKRSNVVQSDEAEDLYTLSDLTLVDEDMQTCPNLHRIQRIADGFGL